jgi:hypothetical protein
MQSKVTSLRGIFMRIALLALLGGLMSACHLDMYNQPKYKALSASDFFADGASARRLVDGTVSRSGLQIDARTTGRVDGDPAGDYVSTIPISIGDADLARGQERYVIYCASCHGNKGNGKGPAAGPYAKGSLGLEAPALFYVDQLKSKMVAELGVSLDQAPDGYYFNVITHGVPNPEYVADGNMDYTQVSATAYRMAPYGYRIQDVDDRWRIIAYIREMQQNPPAE